MTFNINRTWTAYSFIIEPILLHVKFIYNVIRLSLCRRCSARRFRVCNTETFLLQNNLIIPPSKRVALTFTLNYIFPAPHPPPLPLPPLQWATSLYWAMFLIFLLFQTRRRLLIDRSPGKFEASETTEVQVFLIYKIEKFSATETARGGRAGSNDGRLFLRRRAAKKNRARPWNIVIA